MKRLVWPRKRTPLPRGGRAGIWYLAAIVLVAVMGALVWFLWRGPQGTRRLAPDKYRQLVATRNVALGLLENERELDQACQLFDQLAAELPDELLPQQNLAVARLLQAQNEDPTRRDPQTRQQAQQAIEALLQQQPASAAANWLAAKFLERLAGVDETERARKMIELLDRAAEADPQNAVYPMAIYEVASVAADDQLVARARPALEKAYQLSPDNLHVVNEWLGLQVNEQDANVRQTLERAKSLVGPLRLSIQSGDNVRRDDGASSIGLDIMPLIEQASAAVAAGNWDEARGLVGRVRNGINPLIVHRNDAARISPHPLEYVVFEFSDALREANREALPRGTHIEFALQAEQQSLVPADVAGVLDFRRLDFNLDQREDWAVLLPGEVRIYGSAADGQPASLLASAAVPDGARGFCCADLDNDHLPVAGEAPSPQPVEKPAWHEADADFVVYGEAGVVVLENRLMPDGTRQLVTKPQPETLPPAGSVLAATLVDFDHDADLDVILGTENGVRLWSGRGDATFEDISTWSRVPAENIAVRDVVVADWDRDVDIDALVAQSGAGPGFLENGLHGHFSWISWDDDWSALRNAQAVAVADFDGNASWDLAVAGEAGVQVLLTTTVRPGKVQFWKRVDLSSSPHQHLIVGDLDNDGWPDVASWSAETLELFLGEPDGSFTASTAPRLPKDMSLARGRLYDVDGDGDLDLAASAAGRLVLLRNEGGNRNHWLRVRLVGQCDNKGCSGHTGIGSLLELKAGNRYQAQPVAEEVTHFGLGSQERADVLRIVWTNGVPQAIIRPAADQYLSELMTLKGSCPYIYTWTGEKFEFFTDCLWAAPLGMQVARGVLAPARSWEYLRIPGERLQAREGTYDLQITEELWEAGYFDTAQLIAIDHPADVEVFSNEKVGPAEIAEFRVHPVRARRRPVAARDQRGRDVLELVAAEDGRTLAAWDTRLRQGLTAEHYLELELGSLGEAQRIMLFLTGWIYPTNTSLNVAFSQHPELDGPRFPAVWTPNAQGEWQPAIAYMGFPGGKTKTIAVDLSHAFPARDFRVRIVTTAEIYWDGAFFTVDEPDCPLRQTPLTLASADLHYRGFSERIPYHDNQPEGYLYDRVTTAPSWPPMRGRFTRYGDVLPLLETRDDRLVVLGAGDELTLRFRVPDEPPPAGWKRDFFLYSVGWDKDADLNTIHGQSVEPLPFDGMRDYPYDSAAAPSSAEYQDYLNTYQTREQDPARFWRRLQK